MDFGVLCVCFFFKLYYQEIDFIYKIIVILSKKIVFRKYQKLTSKKTERFNFVGFYQKDIIERCPRMN